LCISACFASSLVISAALPRCRERLFQSRIVAVDVAEEMHLAIFLNECCSVENQHRNGYRWSSGCMRSNQRRSAPADSRIRVERTCFRTGTCILLSVRVPAQQSHPSHSSGSGDADHIRKPEIADEPRAAGRWRWITMDGDRGHIQTKQVLLTLRLSMVEKDSLLHESRLPK